jgi:phosphate transport system permease protein
MDVTARDGNAGGQQEEPIVSEAAWDGLPMQSGDDVPRTIVARASPADRVFRGILRAAGLSVLVVTAMILVFLIIQAKTALAAEGFRLLSTSTVTPGNNQFGVAALLPYSAMIALVAVTIAIPGGFATALYISEYAPRRLQRPLIAVIDVLAAMPSIVLALWGLIYLMPRILGFESWLGRYLGFIPVFRVPANPTPVDLVGSAFIAGAVVSILVLPIITSLSRQVFSQAPQGEREAAYALGSTRWGMVRTVVLPFGRAGMIGASMLGLGRALGETIVVSFILILNSHSATFSIHMLQSGGNSITSEIANNIFVFGPRGRSFLMAAGLVLFATTLSINTLASIVVNRSRSGATTQAD